VSFEPLVVADLFAQFDIQKVLLSRSKGASADEVAKKLGYSRLDVIRLLRVINDLSRCPT
jgi:hypothetical protein